MFHGSIPARMKSFMKETVESWGIRELHVGCSGNFTIERTVPWLANHSNDVTLYSSSVGYWATGQMMDVGLTAEALEHVPWLEGSINTPEGLVATLMQGTRFFQFIGKDNAYAERQLKAYEDQWPSLYERTLAKLDENRLTLESYSLMDVREWLDDVVPADAAVACFPPFFAGDYENQDKVLERVVTWTPPTYDLLDEDGKDHLLTQIMERDHWLIGLHQKRDEMEPYLKGAVQTANRGVPIYLYSSEGPRRVVTPRQDLERFSDPKADLDTVLDGTERVSLAMLTGGQFAMMRSQYMNHSIVPGSPLLALAVRLDEHVVGAIAFVANTFNVHDAYMLSDFPVAPTRYLRLSALLPRIAQSTEVQTLLQRSLTRRIDTISTTAFTNNHVSMKYRNSGMKLHTRKPADDGLHEHQLQYTAPIGEFTAQEAYEHWHKKNAKKTRKG